MSPRGRGTRRDLALVALGFVLLAAAVVVPVEPVRWHDTSPSAGLNATGLAANGYEVVAYENLSQRGQELYVATLENGGEYRVPVGAGSDDFDYRTRQAAIETPNFTRGDVQERILYVAVERPDDDSHLPPADERVYGDEPKKYDLLRTKTAPPPLLSQGRVHQFLLALAGVVCIGFGGYRFGTL